MNARDRLFRPALCRKRGLRLVEARTVGGLRRTARLWRVLERVGRRKLNCCSTRGSRLLETRSIGVLRRKL